MGAPITIGGGWVRESGRGFVDTVMRYQVGDSSSVLLKVDEDTLAGEAGALIAKASAKGHFTVRLSWSPGANDQGAK
jgi:hypothetical protein